MRDLARTLGVERLYALCHPDHRASQRVLERCGFDRDPTWTRQHEFPNLDPGVPQNVVCYAITLKNMKGMKESLTFRPSSCSS